MDGMRIGTKGFSLALAAVAALAVASLLAWLFSLQSTLGLFEWDPPWRRNIILIGVAGLLPLLLALASLPRIRDASWRPGALLAVATIAFSALAIALSGGLLAYVLASARAVEMPIPAVRLVDPAAGIEGQGGVARLSLASDPHWGAPKSNAAARSALLRGAATSLPRRDAFIILGDNVEMGMEDGSWREEASDLSASLGDMPVRSMLGNHDGLIYGQYHFQKYFLPAPLKTDSGNPFYYSMNTGPAKIIVIDLLWGAESFDRAQAAWLETTLAKVPAGTQVIVLSHSFIYASGYVDKYGLGYYDNPECIAKVAPILQRHKVALVVSGHDHDMELLRKNGVTYAVIGTMGGILDPEPSYRSPASLWFKAGSYGRLDLDVSAAGIALAFKDQDGAVLREDFIPRAAN
jgi:hypothetical protein